MEKFLQVGFILLFWFFPTLTIRPCYPDDDSVAAAQENVALAIGENDYTKAAVRSKELVAAAGMPEEMGDYAETAFLSIIGGNDSEYLSAIQKLIDHQSAEAEHKAMLLDLAINAPLGAENYALVKQAARLVYSAAELLTADSAPMIILADHAACQNLDDTKGAINAARELLRTPDSALRVLAARNIIYGAIDFSSRRIGAQDRALSEIVSVFKSDRRIMDSEVGPVVLYGDIMSKLHKHTTEGVTDAMDQIYTLHKARNKAVEKDVLYFVGHYVEQLMQSGYVGIEGEEIVFPCYQKLLEVYPDCNEAKYSAWRLFEHAVKEDDDGSKIVYGEFLLSRFSVDDQPVCILYPLAEAYFNVGLYQNAATNYQKFLLKALSTDYRKQLAVEKLRAIESIDPSLTLISDEMLRTIIGGCIKGPRVSGNAGCAAGAGSGSCDPECSIPPESGSTCGYYAGCECIEQDVRCMSGGGCPDSKPVCHAGLTGCTGSCSATGSCYCDVTTCKSYSPTRPCDGSKYYAWCAKD